MSQADPPPHVAGVDGMDALDAVATEALRRLDAMVAGRMSEEAYVDIVVEFLAGEVLVGEPARDFAGDDVGAAAEELLARLSGVLLVELSRRQGNRPFAVARHVAD